MGQCKNNNIIELFENVMNNPAKIKEIIEKEEAPGNDVLVRVSVHPPDFEKLVFRVGTMSTQVQQQITAFLEALSEVYTRQPMRLAG